MPSSVVASQCLRPQKSRTRREREHEDTYRILLVDRQNSRGSATLAAELTADIRRVEDVTKPSVSFWFYISAGLRAIRGVETEIKPIDTNLQGYDRVFVGSPVWGGSRSTPINAFISKADFTGKDVVLFMTMGGDNASGALKKMSERITKKGGNVVSFFALSSGKATNEELVLKTREIAQRYR